MNPARALTAKDRCLLVRQVDKAMFREHNLSKDSDERFPTHYGDEETTSKTEWEAVNNPVPGKIYPGFRDRAAPLDLFLKIAGADSQKILPADRDRCRLHVLRTELAPDMGDDELTAALLS